MVQWQPIEDYSEDPAGLASTELRELAGVWLEQRHLLEEAEGLKTFNERLHREWSIETGLLERIYTLDRGVTQILIERGIDASLIPHGSTEASPERMVAMIRDHEAAIDFIFDFVRGNRPLSTSYIKELHALLTRNQWTTTAIDARGAHKRLPNNPQRPNGSVHEYCPPEQVDSEMERLVDLHLEHSELPPEVEAAWLHHRFTQIHPFQDGNGRVARCLATVVFIRAGWFPLVIRDAQDERLTYIEGLESADAGDLRSLVRVFGNAQRRAFVQALGISGQVLRRARAEQVIDAAVRGFAERDRERKSEWNTVKATGDAVVQAAAARFAEIRQELQSKTERFFDDSEYFVDTEYNQGHRRHYFKWQIVQVARQLHYFANTGEYHSWVRFVLNTGAQSEIIVSVHAAGQEFRGLLAVSAFYFNREETDHGARQATDLTPLSSELFQLNYKEPSQEALARFQDWLEGALVQGLELWRNSV